MESDSDSTFDGFNTSEEDAEEENGDFSHLAAAASIKVNMENVEQKTYQITRSGDDRLADQILESCQVPSGELPSTFRSQEHDDRPPLPSRWRNTGDDRLAEKILESCQVSTGELMPTSGLQEHDDRPPLPPRRRNTVIQYNVIQQKFGDVTVEGTRNLSIGGTLNVSNADPSQKMETEKQKWTEHIMERTISKTTNWTTGMVKTSHLARVMERLNKGQTWITIKGSAGEGKSTVAFMALEELKASGRNVFQVTSPRDFYDVIKNYSKPVILLDDIFGELEFDHTEWMRWKSVFHDVLDMIEHRSHEVTPTSRKDKTVTVILVGRDYVLNSASTKMGRLSAFVTQDSHVINMSHSMGRDLEEKIRIWKAIVEPNEINLSPTEVTEICKINCHHGFPHVCRLFATIYKSNPKLSPANFFQNPLEFLNLTIREFFTHNLKLKLFKEMVRSGGRVSIEDFENAEDGLDIIQTADKLLGTYSRKEENYILFDHPSIYDSVAYNLYNLIPLFVIQNCELSFIVHRLRFQPITESPNHESTHVIQIPQKYHEDLAKRFADEISKRNFIHVLSHDACTDDVFIHKMMSHISVPLTSLIEIGRTDEDPYKSIEKTFLSLIACNKSPRLLKYIADQTGILEDPYETNWVLFGICKFTASDVLKYLKDNSDKFDINAQSEFTGETPLMIAAETKNNEFVHEILSYDPDLNAEDFNDKTALDYLCENGLVSAVEHVFASGFNIDMKNSCKGSPLWWACQTNKVDMIDFLIEKGASVSLALLYSLGYQDEARFEVLLKRGANVNVQDEDGRTPLHTAVERGWTQFLNLLLKAGADVSIQDNNGTAPIYIAAAQRSKETLNLLISAGANVNVQCEGGFTPLHLAALDRSEPCMDLLLKAGADVNVQSSNGYTPLHGVIGNTYGDDDPYVSNFYKIEGIRDVITCATLLLNAKADVNKQDIDGITPLHVATRMKSTELIGILFQAGANVNIKSEEGDTALHTASSCGSSECAALLLRAGSAVNTRNEYDKTPLHCAVWKRSEECVETLLMAGADVNVQTKDGQTPVHIAGEREAITCAGLLLKRGADMNMQDKYGNTPLHEAAKNESVQGVHMLLEAGADVNIQNKDGNTPLHEATEAASTECAKLLLESGGYVAIHNKKGNTPLHVSAERRQKQLFDMFMESGAEINSTDKQGQTALHKAVYRKQDNILELPDIQHCQTLISSGADVNLKDSAGNSPLYLLCQVNSDDPVDEYQPPSCASSCEDVYRQLVTLFVDSGANIGLLNNNGKPALHGWCKTLIQPETQSRKKSGRCCEIS